MKKSIRLYSFLILVISIITACGGNVDISENRQISHTLEVRSEVPEVFSGGRPIAISAIKSGGGGEVSWYLDGNSLGSLSASIGDNVQYSPPQLNAVPNNVTIKITAKMGSIAKDLMILVRPATNLLHVAGNPSDNPVKGDGVINFSEATYQWTSSGPTDGSAGTALLGLPFTLMLDSDNNVFSVEDDFYTEDDTLKTKQNLRKIDGTGTVTTIRSLKAFAYYLGQPIPPARVQKAFARDTLGNLYMASATREEIRLIRYCPSDCDDDTLSDQQVIYKVSPLNVTSIIPVSREKYGEINDIAVDSRGTLFFATNYSIQKVIDGKDILIIAGNPLEAGHQDAVGSAARFSMLKAIHVLNDDNLYVSDKSSIRKIDASGVVSTLAGNARETGHQDGVGSSARFNIPRKITSDLQANLYVADTPKVMLQKFFIGGPEINNGSYTIRKISKDGTVSTIAGIAGQRGIQLGQSPNALGVIHDIRFSPPNFLYIASDARLLKLVLN
jgi:hypothetical protein